MPGFVPDSFFLEREHKSAFFKGLNADTFT